MEQYFASLRAEVDKAKNIALFGAGVGCKAALDWLNATPPQIQTTRKHLQFQKHSIPFKETLRSLHNSLQALLYTPYL